MVTHTIEEQRVRISVVPGSAEQTKAVGTGSQYFTHHLQGCMFTPPGAGLHWVLKGIVETTLKGHDLMLTVTAGKAMVYSVQEGSASSWNPTDYRLPWVVKLTALFWKMSAWKMSTCEICLDISWPSVQCLVPFLLSRVNGRKREVQMKDKYKDLRDGASGRGLPRRCLWGDP